jgi:UDP-glucose 4-epimerase
MNILITGINGMIGKSVAKELYKDNIIFGTSRSKENKTTLQIEYFGINISSSDIITSFVNKQIDIIVHCAAAIESDPLSKELISTNCMGIRNIATLALEHKCKKLVYISSIPIIGRPTQIPITEEHPVFPLKVYHATKYFGELYLIDVLKEIDLVILRIPSPLGIDIDEKKIVPTIIKKCLKNEDVILFGKGQRVQNYIDVKDIAIAVNLAIHEKIKGTYNIASERSYSNREIAEITINLLNSKSKIIYDGIDDEEDNKWIVSIDKAKHDFNFRPRFSLVSSITEMSEYYIK